MSDILTTPKEPQLPDLFIVAEVAGKAKQCKETVLRNIRAGRLPAVRFGKSWRITKEIALRYLAGEFQAGGRR